MTSPRLVIFERDQEIGFKSEQIIKGSRAGFEDHKGSSQKSTIRKTP